MARRTRRRHAAPPEFTFTVVATGSLALTLTRVAALLPVAYQAVGEESNEVGSHRLQHAGHLKEDVVGG
jgi:hypothetical protein